MTEINQGLLVDVVRSIFVGDTILQNVRRLAGIKSHSSGHHLELDIWIPSLALSFEFQDLHHYTTAWYAQSPLDSITEQDATKKESALSREITLIQIPCWWDGSLNSLQGTIWSQRPDLECPTIHAEPVPLNPPLNYFCSGKIPEVGELMQASTPLSLSLPSSPSGWWIGEKYDGFRFCWHPKHKALYTRSGERLFIPNNILQHMPALFVDGEVWCGRGMFPETQKIIYSLLSLIDWASFRGVCFDDADPSTNDLSFEKRYKNIISSIPAAHPFIIPAGRMWCAKDKNREFQEAMEKIVGDAGEGLILRLPHSVYEHGRSTSLIKLKASRDDREALVVDVLDDKISLQQPDGVVFEVKDDLSFPLQRGDVVTFTYTNYTRLSIPFRPTIVRVRHDYPWVEILQDYKRELLEFQPDIKKETSSADPGNVWLQHSDRRRVFEEFAEDAGFDPLLPHNWYSVSRNDLPRAKFSGVLTMYDNVGQALLHLFPEIGLCEDQFISCPSNSWQDSERRRKYFELFAQKNGLDPLIPDDWYKVTRSLVYTAKSSAIVCSFHNASFPQALVDLFPKQRLDHRRFHNFKTASEREFLERFAWHNHFDPHVPEYWYSMGVKFRRAKNANTILTKYGNYVDAVMSILPDLAFERIKFNDEHWRDQQNQRAYFCKFAEEMGPDPLQLQTWYSTSLIHTLLQRQGTSLILTHHHGDIMAALMHAFPDLPLDKKAFYSKGHWQEKENRKAFFESFASMHSFDSLVPVNWYDVPRKKFLKQQNASHVLRYYKGSFAAALLDLYPNIGLRKSKLLPNNNDFWALSTNRKVFLDNFARVHSFDPLKGENWKNVTVRDIKNIKNGRSVLAQCNGNLKQLLYHAYPFLN